MRKTHRFFKFLAQRGHLFGVVAVVVAFWSQEQGISPLHYSLIWYILVYRISCHLPQILQLIIAALLRDRTYLPPSWPEYLLLAVIVVVLLGMDVLYYSRAGGNLSP